MRRLVCREAIVVLLLWPVSTLAGQSDDSGFKTTRFQGQTWVFSDSVRTTQTEFGGRQALHVSSPSSDAIRVAKANFRNGEIEVDLALPDRGVPGIGFRGLSDGTWRNKVLFQRLPWGECNRDESLAQAVVTCRNGTTIVLITHFERDSGGDSGWFHVRLAVHGSKIAIFFDGVEEPIVTLGTVLEDGKGAIGFCGSDFYISNFQFTEEL